MNRISLVVACDRSGTIGVDQDLPWRLPADLKRFKAITLRHAIIMGRKTYDSIGKPLPGRLNIVVSRTLEPEAGSPDPSSLPPGTLPAGYLSPGTRCVVDSPTAALEVARSFPVEGQSARETEIFVIGGGTVYAAFLPQTDRIYRTLVHADVAGDTAGPDVTTFPAIDENEWTLIADEAHPADDRHEYAFSFQILDRNRS